jgi:hypothetical protein
VSTRRPTQAPCSSPLSIEARNTGRAGPVRAHWFDARATLGHHIEVLQTSPELLGFYELIRSSADGWDGSDPLRRP